MKSIAIDSATNRLCIAAKNEDKKASCILDIGMHQSETLLPTIDYLCNKVSLNKQEIQYTTLCQGPGSFTGLRLSFAALKAISHATNTPIYAIPTLEVYAYNYKNFDDIIIPAIDSKKNKFYTCAFEKEKEIITAADYTIEDFAQSLSNYIKNKTDTKIICCGPGAKLFSDNIKKIIDAKIFAQDFSITTTDALFSLAEKNITNNVSPIKEFDGPIYLRESEAEENIKKINK